MVRGQVVTYGDSWRISVKKVRTRVLDYHYGVNMKRDNDKKDEEKVSSSKVNNGMRND